MRRFAVKNNAQSDKDGVYNWPWNNGVGPRGVLRYISDGGGANEAKFLDPKKVLQARP